MKSSFLYTTIVNSSDNKKIQLFYLTIPGTDPEVREHLDVPKKTPEDLASIVMSNKGNHFFEDVIFVSYPSHKILSFSPYVYQRPVSKYEAQRFLTQLEVLNKKERENFYERFSMKATKQIQDIVTGGHLKQQ